MLQFPKLIFRTQRVKSREESMEMDRFITNLIVAFDDPLREFKVSTGALQPHQIALGVCLPEKISSKKMAMIWKLISLRGLLGSGSVLSSLSPAAYILVETFVDLFNRNSDYFIMDLIFYRLEEKKPEWGEIFRSFILITPQNDHNFDSLRIFQMILLLFRMYKRRSQILIKPEWDICDCMCSIFHKISVHIKLSCLWHSRLSEVQRTSIFLTKSFAA